MIYSMTGYGSSQYNSGDKSINVELRSLNSKGLDLNPRIPSALKPYEIELRNLLSELLVRGKVDCTIKIDYLPGASPVQINKTLLKSYLKELTLIAEEQAVATPDLLAIAMRIPNVIDTEEDVIEENEWKGLKEALIKSADQLKSFRKDEGAKLKDDLLKRINLIAGLLKNIEDTEKQRIDKIKNRLMEQLKAIQSEAGFDKSRLEQEMIYFLEKLDVTEEIVRLKTHCNYFTETIENKDVEKGKKLGFIAQEVGREINTIGSKASDAEMQKLVVQMKDELEKIKEQLNNVL
jgi:uncharacterized protein (TIGR00255 family)